MIFDNMESYSGESMSILFRPLGPKMAQLLNEMKDGFSVYLDCGKWFTTSGRRLFSADVVFLINNEWIGDPSLGFYHLTDKGRQVLTEHENLIEQRKFNRAASRKSPRK